MYIDSTGRVVETVGNTIISLPHGDCTVDFTRVYEDVPGVPPEALRGAVAGMHIPETADALKVGLVEKDFARFIEVTPYSDGWPCGDSREVAI